MAQEYKIYEIPNITKMIISSSLPEEVIKQREGGGKRMLSYISGATVTDILNSAFGYNWNWEVKQFFVQESIPYINKYGKNDKDRLPQDQNPVAHVLGTLTVKFKDENNDIVVIAKDGFGSKSILGKQADQESIFKAADTDALKKAASRLGIGLELYRNEEEQGFFEIISDSDEDPWTDEALTKFEKELQYISNIKNKIPDDNSFNELINQFSEGSLQNLDDITPENIQAFAEFLKELEKEAEKEE